MAGFETTTLVLLAAGLSRRYGGIGKLVAPYRGKPLAMHAAETLAALPFARHVAVCRGDDEHLPPLLDTLGFTIVRNDEPERGMASSLSLGVAAAGQPHMLMVCLADMPNITPAHLGALLDHLQQGGIAASVGDPDGPPMPPAVFSQRFISRLETLDGDTGARPLLRQAVRVVAPPGTLLDFDTPDDFTKAP
jgi:molybdenum cofactor cytidylyltransferase